MGEGVDRLNLKRGEEEIQDLFESLSQRTDLAQCPAALESTVEVIASGDNSTRRQLIKRWINLERDPEISPADSILISQLYDDRADNTNLDISECSSNSNDIHGFEKDRDKVKETLLNALSDALTSTLFVSDPVFF